MLNPVSRAQGVEWALPGRGRELKLKKPLPQVADIANVLSGHTREQHKAVHNPSLQRPTTPPASLASRNPSPDWTKRWGQTPGWLKLADDLHSSQNATAGPLHEAPHRRTAAGWQGCTSSHPSLVVPSCLCTPCPVLNRIAE